MAQSFVLEAPHASPVFLPLALLASIDISSKTCQASCLAGVGSFPPIGPPGTFPGNPGYRVIAPLLQTFQRSSIAYSSQMKFLMISIHALVLIFLGIYFKD